MLSVGCTLAWRDSHTAIGCLSRTVQMVLYINLQLDLKKKKTRLQKQICCHCFDENDLFFFEVGHTHSEADRIFSRNYIQRADKDMGNFEFLCRHFFISRGLIEFVEIFYYRVPKESTGTQILIYGHTVLCVSSEISCQKKCSSS